MWAVLRGVPTKAFAYLQLLLPQQLQHINAGQVQPGALLLVMQRVLYAAWLVSHPGRRAQRGCPMQARHERST